VHRTNPQFQNSEQSHFILTYYNQFIKLVNLISEGAAFDMRGKTVQVSAFDAKTRLSELLRQTEQGGSFLICRRGRPVARLLPPATKDDAPDFLKILEAFRELRQRVRGPLQLRKLIERGRRY
jgi:prevent-host-death family protein